MGTASEIMEELWVEGAGLGTRHIVLNKLQYVEWPHFLAPAECHLSRQCLGNIWNSCHFVSMLLFS